MKTIHVKGWAKDIDLTAALSNNYDVPDHVFPFGEEGTNLIPNTFFRFYESDEECSLDEAMEGHVRTFCGDLSLTGSEFGYSEYTVEGFDITALKLGGHDIDAILKSKAGSYLHILIDFNSDN